MKRKTIDPLTPVKMPKSFTPHRGRCSFDQPQETFKLPAKTQIQVFLRNGEIETRTLYEIIWTASYLKRDIIGYKLSLED
jgi:hypothetical protein